MTNSFRFRAPRPLGLRLWHWLNAGVILGSLGTVLLRKTFLSWRDNAPFIEAKVAELGGSVSPEAAEAVAKGLRDVMWAWHYDFGLALAALLLVRVALALWDPKLAPIRQTLGLLRAWWAQPSAERGSAVHFLAVRVSYVVFYVGLLFMVGSGLTMYWHEALGVSDTLREALKEGHELAMWGFAAFVPLHVLGVVLAELRGERGLISDMVNGGED